MARQQVVEVSAGALTLGADMAWVIGSAAMATMWNKAQRSTSGNDILWAVAELGLGAVIAMNVAAASAAPTLRSVSLGVATGGAIYLIDRLLPEAK